MASVQRIKPETPAPERRGLKKGLYLIPSAFTSGNILMGFISIMSALRGFQLVGAGTDEAFARAATLFDYAAIAIGVAMFFDMLDGRIARMTKTTTEMGVQFDSIADVLTFGIAPSLLVYTWSYGSALPEGSPLHKLGWFLSFMYLMCGAFRLARFNVQAARPRLIAEGTIKLDKKSFVGLPIPLAAGMLAAVIHFAPTPFIQYGVQRAELYSALVMAMIACLGALMVSTLRYSSFKTVGTTRRSTRMMILFIAAFAVLVWLFSRYVLLASVTLYVLHGIVFRLFSMLRRKPAEAKKESL